MLTYELGIPLVQLFFWTASQIVLAYIKNETWRFNVFVANRVQTIRMLSPPGQWSHIQGCLNPANVISWGCDVKDLPVSWIQLPEFPWRCKSEWSCSYPAGTDMLEGDPDVSTSHWCGVSSAMIIRMDETAHPMDTLIQHYPSFYKLMKAVSWIIILYSSCRTSVSSGDLSRMRKWGRLNRSPSVLFRARPIQQWFTYYKSQIKWRNQVLCISFHHVWTMMASLWFCFVTNDHKLLSISSDDRNCFPTVNKWTALWTAL